jgi:hypothetical protein
MSLLDPFARRASDQFVEDVIEAGIAAEAGFKRGVEQIGARPITMHEAIDPDVIAPVNETAAGMFDQKAAQIGGGYPRRFGEFGK